MNKNILFLLISFGLLLIFFGLKDNLVNSQLIAKIGNKTIDQHLFSKLVQQNVEKEKLSNNNIDIEFIKNNTMVELIQNNTILDFAENYSLNISDDELLNVITSNPNFMKFNKFNPQTYLDILHNNNIDIKFYENHLKEQLLIDKFISLISKPTKDEINIFEKYLQIENYILLELIDINDTEINNITNKQLENYYNDNIHLFTQDKIFDISYIPFDLNDIIISDIEIQNFYKKNMKQLFMKSNEIIPIDKVESIIIDELKNQKLQVLANDKYDQLQLNLQDTTNSLSFNIKQLNPFQQKLWNTFEINDTFKLTTINNIKMIGKITNISTNIPLPFDDVKDIVFNKLSFSLKTKKSIDIAKEKFNNNNIQGYNLKWIGHKDTFKLNSLLDDENDRKLVLDSIFNYSELSGIIKLPNHIAIYKIKDNRINQNKNLDEIIFSKSFTQLIIQLKKRELLFYLQNEYKNKIFFK